MELLKEINQNTYVIGDTHLFHENILKYEPSRRKYLEGGFPSHEDWLIENWNSVVKENDLVIHLGDFSFKPHIFAEYALFLNGKKILIAGNHDAKDASIYNDFFDLIVANGSILVVLDKDITVFKTKHRLANGIIKTIGSQKILFSHYPVYPEKEENSPITDELKKAFEMFKCSLNIHGHTHSKKLPNPQLINASVECIDFKPRKIKELIKIPLG